MLRPVARFLHRGAAAAGPVAGADLLLRDIPTQRPLSSERGLLLFPSAAVAGALFGATCGAIIGPALASMLQRWPA